MCIKTKYIVIYQRKLDFHVTISISKCCINQDKPANQELKNCFNFFKKEINFLYNVKIIVALGKVAFDTCSKFYKESYSLKKNYYVFGHGKRYTLPDKKILVGCYHPSPRNVNTKRLNKKKMVFLFKKVKKLLN